MSLPTRLRNHRHIIANLGYASPPHLISPRLDMALCHNSALVFKLDPRTITCNLISEFNSYPTIFSNWHFIDIFIYSFWLSGVRKRNAQHLSYTFQFQFLEQNHRASGPLCDRMATTVGFEPTIS